MKKNYTLYTLIALLFLAGCAAQQSTPTPATEIDTAQNEVNDVSSLAGTYIVLSTTTSTYDSGLLYFLVPYFYEETGIEVRIVSLGTGAALQLARDGEADVVLVHARSLEDQFVADGYAPRRHDVMYNDFIIIGPSGVIDLNDNVQYTLSYILQNNLTFLSRGDNSGTHIRELELWEALGLDGSQNTNYMEVGQGMGATLQMAVELDAFTLTDRSTWLSIADQGNLTIVTEFHSSLLNPYGIMEVNTARNPQAGEVFVQWMISERAQYLISIYGLEEFGAPIFFPEA